VDDTATALLMERFYANLLGHRPGFSGAMPQAEALAEAKAWLRGLDAPEAARLAAAWAGSERGTKTTRPQPARPVRPPTSAPAAGYPYDHPYYWAAFVLVGDPD
jgi:CHAT domain-containing protein